MQTVDEAVAALGPAQKILIFTGAGMSTESGIPDFRGPDGLWTKVDPDDFTIERYRANPELRVRGWRMHADGELWGARSRVQPNEGHRAIVRLHHEGRLAGVVTQNVDGLHAKSGLDDELVAELHGNVRHSHCLSCPSRWTTETVLEWVDARFPATAMWKDHLSEYYAPKNFNFWYYFGSLALVVLVIQIVTGIFLVMHYKPDAGQAFASVEYIMRDVPGGWIIRYIHSTGASAFFIVVYLHMFRALLYGSHREPRELVWIFGMLIYLTLMGEAFFGYLLPWGQMSYWGAQVIVNLFGTIPFIGPDLAL